jgi:hypothetical protein
MNSLMASRPSTEGVGGMLRYTASSVKQLAISSRSGFDHSSQNLVTTSSGEYQNSPGSIAATSLSATEPAFDVLVRAENAGPSR